MSKSHIPAFPTGKTPVDTGYTLVFNAARHSRRRSGGTNEPILANTISPLNAQQGRSPNSSHGGSRSGSSHKPVSPVYSSHPSPKPDGSRTSHEGQTGRKKQRSERLSDGVLPPPPINDTHAGLETNYTGVFEQYRRGDTPQEFPTKLSASTRHQSPDSKVENQYLTRKNIGPIQKFKHACCIGLVYAGK